uniref:Uncharacterized protein n=1 Tax=Avena sativa TaxID=4498 RepID=A0ACD5XCI5_AVESA
MSEADATATTMEPPKVTPPVTATGTAGGTLPPPMAEEAVPPPCPDHKRKLGEAEVEEAMLAKEVEEVMQARDAVEGAATYRAEVQGEGGEEEEAAAAETEPKRLRMDGVGDGSGITQTEVHEPVTSEVVNGEVPVISSSEVHVPKECSELPQEDDFPSSEKQSSVALTEETTSHKIEIPHNKVGVLIGYSGETIRCLQIASDAKIEIAQYDEADPNSSSRPIELSGPLENTNKAEQLITDVIPQVDADDSLTLAARPQSGAEQADIHVPSEKAGLTIGKGGQTIMALKTKSGADIQLIPQHLPEGNLSTERKVRLTGNWNEIEVARTMILELISQGVKRNLIL